MLLTPKAMRSWLAVFLSTAMLAAELLAAPERARACTDPNPPAPHFRASPPPANGVLLLDIYCGVPECVDSPLPAELPITDLETGEPTMSRRVYSRWGTYVYKPEQPFVAGRKYEVAWEPARLVSGSPITFEARPAAQLTADDVTVDTALKAGSATVTAGCSKDIALVGSCAIATFTVGTLRFVELHASIAESMASQMQVTFAAWPEGAEQPPQDERPGTWRDHVAQFSREADAYCYRLEITSLVDDSQSVREECIPHGELGEIGVTELSVEQLTGNHDAACRDHNRSLAMWCAEQASWCAANEAAGVDGPGFCGAITKPCEEARSSSGGEMATTGTGTGGTGTGEMIDDQAYGGAAGNGMTAADPPDGKNASCSIAAGRARSSLAGLLIASLAFGLARRRRRGCARC